jgi:hypothetical protein
MKLNLSVDGCILASIPIEAFSHQNDYYLKAFRRLLVIRHQQKLSSLNKEPVFFIEYPVECRKPLVA